MYENHKIFKTMFAGRELVVETGKFAQLSNGSALVRYGKCVVLANATASAKPRDGIDFFPLSVDFEERMYAAGKIPGGFLKREGRHSVFPCDRPFHSSLVSQGYEKRCQRSSDRYEHR